MTEQTPPAAPFPTGHLAANPLPPGIVGALGLGGYQLLADVGGVGAGQTRLAGVPGRWPQSRFPACRTGTQIAPASKRAQGRGAGQRIRSAGGAARLPAAVGVPARAPSVRPAQQGRRGQPGDRRDRGRIPDKHPGLLGGMTVSRALTAVHSLPPAGPPADTRNPELLREVLLALALRDESTTGEQAATLADRALQLSDRGRNARSAGGAGSGQGRVGLGVAEQHARGDDQDAAKRHLQQTESQRHIQEPLADQRIDDQLDRDHDAGDDQRAVHLADHEWERVEHAAERGHRPGDHAASHRGASSGLGSSVGQGLGEAHADSRTDRRRQSDEQRRVRAERMAAAKIGASVERVPSISPTSPGWI